MSDSPVPLFKRTKKEIEDYDFIFVFQSQTKQKPLQKHLSELAPYFEMAHIRYRLLSPCKDHSEYYLLIALEDPQLMKRQAQQLKILKKKKKKAFELSKQMIENEIASNSQNSDYTKYMKFNAARLQNKDIFDQEHMSPFNSKKEDQYYAMLRDGQELFTLDEELKCKYNQLFTFKIQRTVDIGGVQMTIKNFPFLALMDMPEYTELVPIHKSSKYNMGSYLEWYQKDIKEYVGANVQVYFKLVRFMQGILYVPAIAGTFTICMNWYYDYTADDSPWDPIYALIVVLWGIYFVTMWEKQEKWINLKEKTGSQQVWSFRQKMLVDRKKIPSKYSQVTGLDEAYLNPFTRTLLYFRSTLILGLLMLAAVVWMVFSLNARGFIDPQHRFIYIEKVSAWSQPGGIFDVNTNWSNIPIIVHALFINLIDEHIYRKLAITTTQAEKHLQTKTYQNSVIVKYFIYEFLITFADMFYIAFVRFDIIGLKQQLVSLFFVDIVRRLVAETLVPWLTRKFKSNKYKKSYAKGLLKKEELLDKQATLQVSRPSYEPFDDYLEIVTNFGYLVMLSSCFPISPLLIIISHLIEVIHDKYKILFIYKRSLPRKFVGIGFWKDLLVFICYMSIITNILLFAFSSQQIVGFFPRLFDSSKDVLYGNKQISEIIYSAMDSIGDFINPDIQCSADPISFLREPVYEVPTIMLQSRALPTHEKESSFVVVVFVLEHILIILVYGIRRLILVQKDTADVFLERRNYKRAVKARMDKNSLLSLLRQSTQYSQKIRSQSISSDIRKSSIF